MKKIAACWIALLWMVLAAGALDAQNTDAPALELTASQTLLERLPRVMTAAGEAGRGFTAIVDQLGLGRLPALLKIMEGMQQKTGQVCESLKGGDDTRLLEEAEAFADRLEEMQDLLSGLEAEFRKYLELQGQLREEYGQFPEALHGPLDDSYRRIAEAAVDTVLAWNGGRVIDALKAGGKVRILVSDAGYFLDETELTVAYEYLKSRAAAQLADPETAKLLAAMEQAFNHYMQTHARAREAAGMLIEIEVQQAILELKVEEGEQVIDTLEERGDDAADQLDALIEQIEEKLERTEED